MIAEATGTGPWLETIMRWSNVETSAQLGLVAFGVLAQLLFFARWVVQWLATEARGRSHVPLAFWWLSLIGASLLLLYFILRREPVGVLGQSIGWAIYTRNLILIRRRGSRAAAAPPAVRCPQCGYDGGP